MINALTAQLLPGVSRNEKSKRPQAAPGLANAPDRPAHPPRPGAEGFAASIMADGGLGFLQSRLEDKMGDLFEKATENNPELAAAGPEAFFDTSADVSPDATADRIVGFALGMKGTYARQNPDLDPQELMARFESEIRRGIEDGFGHARGVLGGLELLEGQVKDNVDVTWDLVQQKLEDFFRPPPETETE